jgi:hypothetical protein
MMSPKNFSGRVFFVIPFFALLMKPPGAFAMDAPVSHTTEALTYQCNIERTGANTNEFLLTPQNVKPGSFGKLFWHKVDGAVYAEPLYVAGVEVPGKGRHNAVFVVTQHGGAYAFDADDGQGANAAPLWQVTFIDPSKGIVPFTTNVAGLCNNVPREDSIAATPVIDRDAGTIFFEVLTCDTNSAKAKIIHRLHALDIRTGKEQPNSPMVIEAAVKNVSGGTVSLDNRLQQCRTGLLLVNGVLYFAYSAQCDEGKYHGWVVAYDEKTLKQVGVYNDTPNGSAGGIWNGTAGMSADAGGNIYTTTGNGDFNTNYPALAQCSLSDSFLKFTGRDGITLVDYFTPHNQDTLNKADLDISAGSTLVLPDSVGSAAHPHLLVGAGKDGTIYLLDRDKLGGFNAQADTQVVAELPNAVGKPWNYPVPAYFNNLVYYQCSDDVMKAFRVEDGAISSQPVTMSANRFGPPGAIPSVSASGNSNGIVWILEAEGWAAHDTAVLHAYDAVDLRRELYNSDHAATNDAPGPAVKFTIPMVANGKVYVGGDYYVAVYGLTGAPKAAP